DGSKDDEEACHADQVVQRVVGVEGNAVDRSPLGIFGAILDFDAVGVVGAHFVQGNDVSHHQTDQHQRNGDDVEGEETVERRVGNNVVTADPQRELGSDEGNGREEVHNNLCTPVRHLAPGQQVAHEGFAHQAKEDGHAEDPDELARLAVRAIEQAAQHVQVHNYEEHRCACGVHVADQPAPGQL